jgi:tetrahydromethanopterin S-methyltransferase subunit E
MGQNTFSIGASLKRALPSLVMFAIGFFIVYKFLDEHNIYYCIMLGWVFGGTIWGWFLTGKWFSNIILKCILSPVVGVVVMPIGIIQLIIAIILLFINRGKAKKAREEAITGNTED